MVQFAGHHWDVLPHSRTPTEMQNPLISVHSYATGFLIALVSTCLPCFGTAIVIWVNRDGIVAGSDSLAGNESATGVTQEILCKIQPVGKFYIASARYWRGFQKDRPSELTYSTVEIARSLASQNIKLEDLVPRFIDIIQPKLQLAMFTFYREEPARFMSEANGTSILSVSIFGMSDEGPRLATVNFKARVDLLGVMVEHSPPSYCSRECSSSGGVLRLGSQNVSRPRPLLANTDEAIPWVVDLIESEIKESQLRSERDHTLQTVGGPVSVLVLTRSVTRWAEGYHEACPEQLQ